MIDGGGEVGSYGRPYQSFTARRKMYRKRRRHEGEDIDGALAPDIEDLERAKRDNKVYCRPCGRFHAWKDLWCRYEMRGEDLWRIWFCNKTDAMVKEDNLDERPGTTSSVDGLRRPRRPSSRRTLSHLRRVRRRRLQRVRHGR